MSRGKGGTFRQRVVGTGSGSYIPPPTAEPKDGERPPTDANEPLTTTEERQNQREEK